MKITSQFDSGNIEVISATDPADIRLAIRKDNQSDFYQWFHFRLNTPHIEAHTIKITNVNGSAYPDGWKDYQAVASYDRENWFRVDTEYNGKELVITHYPEAESIYFAYFAPYSYEQHLDLLQQAHLHDRCQLVELGDTLDGRDMSLLVIGEPAEGKRNIWITARQHPGETMAEWFVEGLLDRLLDDEDAVARSLLDEAVFYVVPNMNPDGSVRGHLRTNAIGVNLNREWQTPSMEKSPEVYLVREKMMQVGVDMYLDVHGDENIPYNFLAGSEGVPCFDERMSALEQSFRAALLTASPEFQNEHGYEVDAPGKANLTVASNWVAEQFNCLAFTLEMPFKDNDKLPDELYGWSDVRSMKFGRDSLTAILAVAGSLR
ncbi:M14-type cytosolic carboxypeptidase [Alkalimonas collagenimarina]|uniref:M14-type cytosolic carboxypeptidase n=1 Tax=Alkalimonas collagenimarina TaxID=400390 RepID=A0ABT9GW16_9GAMM|nr:M14-type cytosolic carboxypeptidase [Alkalimonas collagenimarina]MDP4535245.1 M14-type cytosolic carboxypeptidase [Alkalimonas collagenimarina]